jgi:phosphosulfolactate synthase (CoM biosynthesis protein A)
LGVTQPAFSLHSCIAQAPFVNRVTYRVSSKRNDVGDVVDEGMMVYSERGDDDEVDEVMMVYSERGDDDVVDEVMMLYSERGDDDVVDEVMMV